MTKENLDRSISKEGEDTSSLDVVFTTEMIEEIDNNWDGGDFDLQGRWKMLDKRAELLSGRSELVLEKAKNELRDAAMADLEKIEKSLARNSQGKEILGLVDMADLDLIKTADALGDYFWNFYENLDDDSELKMRFTSALGRFDKFSGYLHDEFGISESAGRNILNALIRKKRLDERKSLELEEIKAKTATDDDARIKELRKYFDPEEELLEISKSSRAEKKARLEKFKEDLAEYKSGNAIVNTELERMILANDVFDEYAAHNFVDESAEKYKWSPTQINRYRYFLQEVQRRNKYVNQFAEKYANVDDAVFFHDLFGFSPAGKVEIKRSSISFCIICDDLNDYARIYGESVERANLTGGFAGGRVVIPELYGAVTFVNGSMLKNYPVEYIAKSIEETRVHEDRHILHSIIERVERLSSFEDDFENRSPEVYTEKAINDLRAANEVRAKDEIFAYIKDGRRDIISIEKLLFKKKSDGGLYDYFESDNRFIEYLKTSTGIDLDDKFEKSKGAYRENIKRSLEMVDLLMNLDFSKEKVIGLLQPEKLTNWSKILKRVISANPEIRKKIDDLAVQIDEATERIDSNIAYEQSRLAKNKKKSIINYYKKLDVFLYNKLVFNNRFIPRIFKAKYAMMNPEEIASVAENNLKYLQRELEIKLAQKEKIISL